MPLLLINPAFDLPAKVFHTEPSNRLFSHSAATINATSGQVHVHVAVGVPYRFFRTNRQNPADEQGMRIQVELLFDHTFHIDRAVGQQGRLDVRGWRKSQPRNLNFVLFPACHNTEIVRERLLVRCWIIFFVTASSIFTLDLK